MEVIYGEASLQVNVYEDKESLGKILQRFSFDFNNSFWLTYAVILTTQQYFSAKAIGTKTKLLTKIKY